MAAIIVKMKRNGFFWAFFISFLLHFLILILFLKNEGLVIFQPRSNLNKTRKRPIAFEIVETPEHARVEESQEEATLLSDKNAIAMDNVESDLPIAPVPFSKGISTVKEIPEQAGGPPSQPVNSRQTTPSDHLVEEEQEEGTGEHSILKQRSSANLFSSEMLFGRSSQTRNSAYRQEEASTQNTGGMSFNTYNWEFAPYMIKLKRKIQKNIFPPSAFTRLGFGGTNLLRFRIYPDGRLEGPDILDFQGEQALVQTSRKAIELSAPFFPLPDTFPEPFLEVTARFEYFIR